MYHSILEGHWGSSFKATSLQPRLDRLRALQAASAAPWLRDLHLECLELVSRLLVAFTSLDYLFVKNGGFSREADEMQQDKKCRPTIHLFFDSERIAAILEKVIAMKTALSFRNRSGASDEACWLLHSALRHFDALNRFVDFASVLGTNSIELQKSSGTLSCFWVSILPTIWPEVIGGFQA
jgi:hypothetical protein